MLVGGKNVDKTIDGLARVVCVQRAEDKESGLGSGESEGDGFEITHLTYKHDVSIFPQGGTQAVSEGRGLDGDFPLSDDTALVAVHELDRFFHRDDVAGEVRVDVVEEGCECGGFSRSGGTGDEDQSGAHVSEFLYHSRDIQILQRGNFSGDETEDGSQSIFLLEVVAAKAGFLVHLIGEVEVAAFEIALEGFLVADLGKEVLEVVSSKNGLIGNGRNGSVNPNFRGSAF